MKLTCVLVLLLSLFMLPACKQDKESPPIPEEQMQEILLDMHLAETYSQGLGDSTVNRFQKNYDSLAGFYTSILKHHNLSFESFNEALEWYKERPDRIDTLYARVLGRLTEIKAGSGIGDIEEEQRSPSPSSGVRDTALPKKQIPGATLIRNPAALAKPKTDTAVRRNKINKPVTKSEP